MKKYILISIAFVLLAIAITYYILKPYYPSAILTYIVDPRTENLSFYWKDDEGKILNSIEKLSLYVESRNMNLKFATNGGMFDKSFMPIGHYVENSKMIKPVNLKVIPPGSNTEIPNFYLTPNGIFYITKNNYAFIKRSKDYLLTDTIKYATQSGPMLVIDGKINNIFKKGSRNLNVRNGVGIMPDNKVIFAMSKSKINF